MANYHVLEATPDGNTLTVVHHVPVSGAMNLVDTMTYREALVEWIASQGGSTTSRVPNLEAVSPGEQAQLDLGERYEVTERFDTDPSKTPGQNRDALRLRHAEIAAEQQDEKRNMLDYWGYNDTF